MAFSFKFIGLGSIQAGWIMAANDGNSQGEYLELKLCQVW